MAIQTYTGIVSDLKATLVDGYLPDKYPLIQTAEEVAKEIEAMSENERKFLQERPYSWDRWDEDALFEYIAFNTRNFFHKKNQKGCSGYATSEAWLLNPQKWDKEYELKNPPKDQSGRRLFVTLYQGCKCGTQCMNGVIKKSGLEIIPGNEYKNIKAFKQNAHHLLEEVSLPFRAPCIVGEDKMTQMGYDFRTFGK